MDTVTLNIILKDENGMNVKVRLNDIRSDVTSAEVLALANKFIDDNILTNKGRSITDYLGAEKISIERLE